MNPILDSDEEPLSQEEWAAFPQNAEKALRIWRKRALYSIAALVLSCASVSPFLPRHPFHDQEWRQPGALLFFLSLAVFGVCLHCCLAWLLARSTVRTLNKG
jgi:hypothetical protein